MKDRKRMRVSVILWRRLSMIFVLVCAIWIGLLGSNIFRLICREINGSEERNERNCSIDIAREEERRVANDFSRRNDVTRTESKHI